MGFRLGPGQQRRAARGSAGHAAHLRHLPGRRPELRPGGRPRPLFAATRLLLAGDGLRRILPQHTGAGADHLVLLRPADPDAVLDQPAGGGLARHLAQLGGLLGRDLSRWHPVDRSQPVGRRAGAWHDLPAGDAPHHPAPGLEAHDAGAHQPRHRNLQDDDARLGHRLCRAVAAGQADRLAELQSHRGLHGRRGDLLRLPVAAGAAHLRAGAAPGEGRMTILGVSGLTKRFGTNTVIAGIDLDVKKGERIAVLGASGSGKSTLLRCLNFMEMPDAGTITLDGKVIGRREAELTLVRQRIGMVFQQFNLFPHMTALGNVMEGLRTVRRMSKPDAQARAERELARVGLADKAAHYPAHLSGGQKQRVAIARALAMDPELLLFDEPTSALDPELVGEVLSVIRALAEEGRTMLLVTHELGFAYHVATRVIFLANGTIHEQGTPDEVLKHPRRERTQAFLARHKEFSL